MRVVTFKAEEDLLEIIDRVAQELGLTRSEVIRIALESYIKIHRTIITETMPPRKI